MNSNKQKNSVYNTTVYTYIAYNITNGQFTLLFIIIIARHYTKL